jgi:hypothetical protein
MSAKKPLTLKPDSSTKGYLTELYPPRPGNRAGFFIARPPTAAA